MEWPSSTSPKRTHPLRTRITNILVLLLVPATAYADQLNRSPSVSTASTETLLSLALTVFGLALLAALLWVYRVKQEAKRNRQELRARESLLAHSQALGHIGSWVLDIQQNQLTWSDETYRIFGLPLYSSLTYEIFLDRVHPEDRESVDQEWKAALSGKPYDIEHRILVGNQVVWVREKADLELDTSGNCVRAIGFVQDITDRKRREAIQATRLRLVSFAEGHSVQELLQRFLDEAETLTESSIGFYHFVTPDEQGIHLQTWSTNTLKHMCKMKPESQHYPIAKAGVWVDCVRERKAIVHNDYESLPHKKGLPKGHAPIKRELVVPVFRKGKIRAILGVGNKADNYTDEDVEAVQQLADLAWETVVRRQAEEELQENLDTLRMAQRIAQIGSWSWDLRTDEFTWSEEMYRIHGLEVASAPPALPAVREQILPEDREAFDKAVEGARLGEITKSIEYRIKTPTGELRHILATARASGEKTSRPQRILGTVQNITERKLWESQLFQAEKLTAIGQLAGGVAHDFNNQLAGVLGYADMLTKRLKDEGLKRYAENIRKAARRSADLTEQLLAFGRKGKNLIIPVKIHEILQEVTAILERSIDKRISIQINFNASPDNTLGDPTQLQNAFLNLGLNARDAIHGDGEILFETDLSTVDEGFAENHPYTITPGTYLKVSVTDTGSGMNKEVKQHLFEPFYTTKEEGKGTGMGLASVYGTIRNHHGAITVYSEEGNGTTFRVYLPLCTKEEIPGQRKKRPLATGSGHILLIDDEEGLRSLGRDMLEDLGYRVSVFDSGPKAIEHYRQTWQEIDLVILDMVMPELGGREVFLAMKEVNPSIHAILASGYSLNGRAQSILDEGVMAFVGKPFEQDELSQRVSELLAPSDPPQQAD
ncbi:MAG: hybrid sensor histidine kinase/response regulator [Planctomycetota bacterium]|jgi:PAS domain S-box-containing protein